MDGWLGRIARLPFGLHIAGIAIVLLALLPLLDGGLFSADEGAAMAQVDMLERTGEWTAPNPAPEIDPEREALPVELAFRGSDGTWAPFSKHAVYISGLRGALEVGGDNGGLFASIAGTLFAAAAAGLLARRLAPGTEAAAAWLTGIGSPLLFDSYLVMAHAVGAGLAGWAAVAALGASDRSRTSRRRVLAGAGCLILAVVGGLLRTEALLMAPALGAGVIVASARSLRRPDVLGVALGLAIGAAAPVALLLGRVADEAAWGSSSPDGSILAGDRVRPSGLSGRTEGFLTTWLQPSYEYAPLLAAAVVGVVFLWGAVVICRRRGEPPAIALFAIAGGALVVLRVFAEPAVVPGLVVTLPALAGLAGLEWETVGSVPGRLLSVSAGLFALGVLATQYPEGGAGEWGGRYFAIMLPLVAPLAVAGLADVTKRATRSSGRVLVGSVVLATVVMTVGSVLALRDTKYTSTSVVERVDELRREVGTDGHPATVLTTTGSIGRFSWEHLDEGHWHTVARRELERYSDRLAMTGEQVLLFTREPDEDLSLLEQRWVAEPLAGAAVYELTPR